MCFVDSDEQTAGKNALAIDVQKLYNMPSKLVDTCEQTLLKRKEIIDWFDTLKSQDKVISINNSYYSSYPGIKLKLGRARV